MTSTGVRPRKSRPLLSLLGTVLAGALAVSLAPPAAADDLPPGRRIKEYVVRPGDTATGLAVRHHAWTDELISHNHLGPDGMLVVGQRIEIPVVVSAVPERRAERRAERRTPDRADPGPSRGEVRRAVVRTAREVGVDPQLALAVSWQESGWRMDRTSSAGAIGAMQVMPDTGDWMSLYTGRRLGLRDLRDNVLAGVTLLRVLDDNTASTSRQVAAYYQGLGAVQEHGIYRVSEPYVANVLALKRRLERGWDPTRG